MTSNVSIVLEQETIVFQNIGGHIPAFYYMRLRIATRREYNVGGVAWVTIKAILKYNFQTIELSTLLIILLFLDMAGQEHVMFIHL